MILLALNDHYLKWQYANWLTGKLSDFSGLLIFPMFLAFLFPRLEKMAAVITGLAFIFWKLPFSEDFIKLYNQITFIPVTRTVDYSDLIVLSVLPLSHHIIQRIENFKVQPFPKQFPHPALIIFPCSFIFISTSPPISYYMKPGGDIHIGKSFKINMSRDEFLEKLKAEGLTVNPDTSQQAFRRGQYYFIENAVLAGGKDTIKSIQFGFFGQGKKTLLLLNNVSLNGERKISDWKELKRYLRYYQKLIDDEIIDEVR